MLSSAPTSERTNAPGASDAQLIACTKEGDAHAFTKLVERYYPAVFATARAHVRHRETAEEIAQETFLRAFLKLDTLERPEFFPVWVHRIARNLSTDWLRRGKRRSDLITMIPIDSETAPQIVDAHAASPHDIVSSKEQDEQIAAAVHRLPEELRETLLLHFVEELTNAEIARRVGIDRSSVGRRIQTALALLREEFGANAESAVRIQARPRANAIQKTSAVVVAASLLAPDARAAIIGAASNTASGATAQLVAPPKLLGGFLPAIVIGVVAITLSIVATGTYLDISHDNSKSGSVTAQENTKASAVRREQTSKSSNHAAPGRQLRASDAGDATSVALHQRTISGFVVDPQQQPVSGVTVELLGTVLDGKSTSTMYGPTNPTQSDRNGFFRINTYNEDALDFTSSKRRILSYILRFSPPRPQPFQQRSALATELVYFIPPDTHDLRVQLKPGAIVSGRVLYIDENGTTRGLAGAQIHADSERDAWSYAGELTSARTAKDGSYEFAGLSGEMLSRPMTNNAISTYTWMPRTWVLTCQGVTTTVVVQNAQRVENVDFIVSDRQPWVAGEWKVSGNVFDASTSKPLPSSKVMARVGTDAGWDPWYELQKEHPDQTNYTVSSAEGKLVQLRAEAPEFAHVISPVFRGTAGEQSFDFYLSPSAGIMGVVIGPDYAPVAGAKVGVYWNGGFPTVCRNGFGPWDHEDDPITDSRGVFHLQDQPPDRDYRIFVQSDAGYADVAGSELSRSMEIRLKPWCRVEGTYLVGNQPQANATVLALAGWMNKGRPREQTCIEWHYESKTDLAGHFIFERMLSEHYCYVRPKAELGRSSGSVLVRLNPGQTSRVQIGGSGRPVIGTINIPAGIDSQHLHLNLDTDRTYFINLPGGSTGDGQKDQEAWLRTDAGWNDMSSRHSFDLQLAGPDGRFRFDDVPPGQYRFIARAATSSADVRTTLTIPESSEGGNEPVDLGALNLSARQ